MTEETEAPERIWAVSGYGCWQDEPPASGLRTGQWTEYIRKDISDARIAELEANINIKADWIEATINDMAAQDQELHEMKARIAELEAKLAKAIDGLRECKEEIDDYVRQEYPGKHPLHAWYRQRDFAANPARTTLAEIKGGKDG